MSRILIVEDDFVIAEMIAKGLRQWGFDAHIADDFQNVVATFHEYDPHLILMDISLPFYNGYYWCTEIRKVSKVPIIFLPPGPTKWILLWLSIWVGMTISASRYLWIF